MKESLKNKPAIVYCAVNSVNGHKYIGMTSSKLEKRMVGHRFHSIEKNRNGHFQNAIRKYGLEVFNWYTLSKWENYKDALNEEVRVIALINPEYNMTVGGEGIIGITPSRHFLGKKHTQESKIKMSKSLTGKRHTEKTKNKMSLSRIGNKYNLGKTLTIDHKNKISKSLFKKVICLDDNSIFYSAKNAAYFFNIKSGSRIGEVCNGKRKSCGGKHFSWYTEEKEAV